MSGSLCGILVQRLLTPPRPVRTFLENSWNGLRTEGPTRGVVAIRCALTAYRFRIGEITCRSPGYPNPSHSWWASPAYLPWASL